MLLRQSVGICRVTHILRTVDPTLIATELEALDSMYLNTTRYLFSSEFEPDTWVQVGLPIKSGGLGLSHCTEVAPLAFIASSIFFADQCQKLGIPAAASLPTKSFINACRLLSPTLGPAVLELGQAVSKPTEPLRHSDPQAQSQRWWTSLLHSKSLRDLLS